MRTECLNSRYVYDRPFPVSRLVTAVGNSILTVHAKRMVKVVNSICETMLTLYILLHELDICYFP